MNCYNLKNGAYKCIFLCFCGCQKEFFSKYKFFMIKTLLDRDKSIRFSNKFQMNFSLDSI